MKNVVILYNKSILINTSEDIIRDKIIKYFDGYTSNETNYNEIDLTVNVTYNKKLYNNSKIQYLCENRYTNSEFIAVLHKDNIVIVKLKKKELYIVLESINDENIELVNRIIINCILKILENDNIYFIEASCIALENHAIAFLGDRDFTKDIINELLKWDYNYVSSEKIGLKIESKDIKIFNLPERSKMRYTYCSKINIDTILKTIVILENRMPIKKMEINPVERHELISLLVDNHDKCNKSNISYIDKIYPVEDMKIDYNYIYRKIENFKITYGKKDLEELYKLLHNRLIKK